MEALIGVASFVGFIVCLVLFILRTVKKRPKKKVGIGMAVCFVLFIGAFAAAGDTETKPAVEQKTTPTAKPQKVESVSFSEVESSQVGSQVGESSEKNSGSYTLPCGLELFFEKTVRNDVTGKWRIAKTASSLVVSENAVEYYNEMFSSDDEIHGIWNATLNTTTKISKSSNLLFVDTYEYVDGEEHDANLLFSGMLLTSEIIDINTGLPWEG